MDKSKKQFAINVLRRGSYRHYARWQASNRAKIGRNEYFCEICGVIGPKRNYQLDHKIPVIPLEGFDNFDNYIDRLYCDVDGYQLICIPCHKEKSATENAQRPAGERKKK